jgi:hypothetical protein
MDADFGTCESLGPVGVVEARRLRDDFVAEVHRGHAREPASERRRATFGEIAEAWLSAKRALVDVDELAPSTVSGYEISVRLHLTPWFGARPICTVSPDDLVAWHAYQRRTGAASWTIKGRSNTLLVHLYWTGFQSRVAPVSWAGWRLRSPYESAANPHIEGSHDARCDRTQRGSRGHNRWASSECDDDRPTPTSEALQGRAWRAWRVATLWFRTRVWGP